MQCVKWWSRTYRENNASFGLQEMSNQHPNLPGNFTTHGFWRASAFPDPLFWRNTEDSRRSRFEALVKHGLCTLIAQPLDPPPPSHNRAPEARDLGGALDHYTLNQTSHNGIFQCAVLFKHRFPCLAPAVEFPRKQKEHTKMD